MQKIRIIMITSLLAGALVIHPAAWGGKANRSKQPNLIESVFNFAACIQAMIGQMYHQLTAHQQAPEPFNIYDSAFYDIPEAMAYRLGIRQALALDIVDFIRTGERSTTYGNMNLDDFLKHFEDGDLQAIIENLIHNIHATNAADEPEGMVNELENIVNDFIDDEYYEDIIQIYLYHIVPCFQNQTDYMQQAIDMAGSYDPKQLDPALAGIPFVDIVDYRGKSLVKITRSYRLNITAIEDFIRGDFNAEQDIEHLAESIYDQLLAELNGRQSLKLMKSQRYAELKIDKKPRIFVYRDGNRFVLIGASLKDDDKTDATDKRNANKHLDEYLKTKR